MNVEPHPSSEVGLNSPLLAVSSAPSLYPETWSNAVSEVIYSQFRVPTRSQSIFCLVNGNALLSERKDFSAMSLNVALSEAWCALSSRWMSATILAAPLKSLWFFAPTGNGIVGL